MRSFQDGVEGADWTPEDGNRAAEYGHLGLMKIAQEAPVWEKSPFKYTHEAMDLAAKNRFIAVLDFLCGEGHGCTTDAMDSAAAAGHLDVVKWLHKHRTEGATKAAMDWAAAKGHLQVVTWLHHNRKEGCTVSAMNWAAEGGHLHVVKWLHENR
ncbi:unnamed protein product [Choristocarpus tenellus]